MTLLEGSVSDSRMKALEDEGTKLTFAEKGLYTKRKLAKFFEEPGEGALYVILAVRCSIGQTAYWRGFSKSSGSCCSSPGGFPECRNDIR
jgi:hypothetical protein